VARREKGTKRQKRKLVFNYILIVSSLQPDGADITEAMTLNFILSPEKIHRQTHAQNLPGSEDPIVKLDSFLSNMAHTNF
jgi:hypothetical protein